MKNLHLVDAAKVVGGVDNPGFYAGAALVTAGSLALGHMGWSVVHRIGEPTPHVIAGLFLGAAYNAAIISAGVWLMEAAQREEI